ncbi:MAG: 23S rRNA (adenine(2030)-N(6))-methyltransferase RlmJ [Magnetospirillum sp.]|nr:23S rRNA (adenine(2030)-N(6))-methyltransferase RlmJ [Magnetospirillum sp.]
MNYRHAFHAGNFADVVKHATYAWTLARLAEKPKPFAALDTHAGLGEYDLDADQAARTGEWRTGIGRVRDALGTAPAALAPYAASLAALDPRFYPGSPRVAAAHLRAEDRLILCEKHPADAETLRRTFAEETRVEIRADDGYAVLKAALPPKERRGVVLIDPPFEAKDEFARLAGALRQGLKRFATGTFLVWYPIKDRAGPDALIGGFADGAVKRVGVCEIEWAQAPDGKGLRGCGMLSVNAPWRYEEAMHEAWGWCADRFPPGAQIRVETVVGE